VLLLLLLLLLNPLLRLHHWITVVIQNMMMMIVVVVMIHVWRQLQMRMGERRRHLIRWMLLQRIGIYHKHWRSRLGASHHSGTRKIVVIVKIVEGIVEGTVEDLVVAVVSSIIITGCHSTARAVGKRGLVRSRRFQMLLLLLLLLGVLLLPRHVKIL